MSVKVSSWVWHSEACADIAGSELVLLIALADVADDQGRCRYITDENDMSYEGLAAKVRVDRRTIERLVPRLRDRGVLEYVRGTRGRTNDFRVLVPWAKRQTDKMSVSSGVDSPTFDPDSPTSDASNPDNMSVDSSYLRSDVDVAKKPSRKRPATTLPEGWKPSAANVALAESRGLALDMEAERFKASALSKDRRYSDWDAAFRNWLLSPYAKPIQKLGDDWFNQ